MDPTLAVLYVSLSYLGAPYRYGGTDSTGFDCSGFVSTVLKKFGYSPPRTASEMAKWARPVPIDSMRPGDLLFFDYYKRPIGHVGIYLGNGKMIHASSKRGVVIDDLRWHRKHLVKVGRVPLPLRIASTFDTPEDL